MSIFEWFKDVNNRVVVWACVTVVAITCTLVSTTALTVYVMEAEGRVQARVGRLAATITRTASQVNRELQFRADDVDTLLRLNRYPWTRNNMIEFCIEAEKKNAGFVCPDVIELSPDLDLLGSRERAQALPKIPTGE